MGEPKRKEKSEETPRAPGPEGKVLEGPWVQRAPLTRFGKVAIGLVVLLINLPLLHHFLLRRAPAATVALPARDDFSDADTVTKNYFATGGFWRVVNGELLSPGVRNNPLWLKASLPQDVAVEFDVRSQSPEGDIKVELFGDGTDHASGYVFIHGGWNNSKSIIARLDEHGPSTAALPPGSFRPDTRVRVEANPFKVEVGRRYHWRIERRGGLLRWSIDGQPFMQFDDPFPLAGAGHDRFGFSSWEAQLSFDNLSVQAL